jgi:very-short-patch-repair endonuclease
MAQVFIGSEAVAAGKVTKYDLRARYQRLVPDVYIVKGTPPSLRDRIVATWLWSQRQGVISGVAASALHGAKWVDHDAVVEVNWPGRKPPPGVKVREDTLLATEITAQQGIPVTSIARTAFDLARGDLTGRAVERLDALAAVTNVAIADVLAVAENHQHVKGLRQVSRRLELMDSGSQSPRETWLRLLLMGAGFPRPQTQIPVARPGGRHYFLDMGWPDVMVAVEYDGEQHRVERGVYDDDLIRSEYIAHVGWRRVRVIAGHRKPDIVRRVHEAWR